MDKESAKKLQTGQEIYIASEELYVRRGYVVALGKLLAEGVQFVDYVPRKSYLNDSVMIDCFKHGAALRNVFTDKSAAIEAHVKSLLTALNHYNVSAVANA